MSDSRTILFLQRIENLLTNIRDGQLEVIKLLKAQVEGKKPKKAAP